MSVDHSANNSPVSLPGLAWAGHATEQTIVMRKTRLAISLNHYISTKSASFAGEKVERLANRQFVIEICTSRGQMRRQCRLLLMTFPIPALRLPPANRRKLWKAALKCRALKISFDGRALFGECHRVCHILQLVFVRRCHKEYLQETDVCL